MRLPAGVRRYAEHPFWQAVTILVVAYVVIVFVIPLLPGSALVPKSVVLQYMATVLVGVLIYVSDNEGRWHRFQDPIRAMLVERRLKLVRGGVLVAVTLLVGCFTLGQVRTTVSAPPNLRSIHPAPPADITFRGKAMTLTGLENPLRHEADSLAAHLALGKRVYYENCLPCHGDHLDGQGHYATAFNPLPANFQDNGTIAQLTESFVFWRIAKGGPGLPREGAPWNSAMPVWEDFLSEREIWSVILFLYDQTGWKPRTWETESGKGETGKEKGDG
ncbi:MAG: cytochrome C [Gemmatimonadetes bacterium]|nr:MAG: cytochrome C [Gemmatimonadota bacterium]